MSKVNIKELIYLHLRWTIGINYEQNIKPAHSCFSGESGP